ncbi:MAG: SdrD B-like domain-containing protein [Pseudolysinimonas sp.]
MPSYRARARRFALSLTAVVALVAGLVTVPAITGTVSPAVAAGTPDVQLTRTVAAQTLYGRDVSVTLQASAPDETPDVDGFNLTFSDLLPAGATVTSTSFPITDQITQLDGSTLLIWSNVADLLDGASVTLTYTFSYPVVGQAGQRDVGDTFAGTAHAYVNTDPYTVPDPLPIPADGSVWQDVSGSGVATSSTLLVPYLVDVRELPSPESELLRGVHGDKTVYQITVTNNTVAPTTNPDVTAYLPASLEFLGCTAVDNSAAPEYPGAPSLAASFPTLVGCNPQYTATTVTTDPDGAGSQPTAVYTRVVWDLLPDLAASDVITMQYAAAIPLHANVAFAGNPVANLDNNTGAEANDEQAVVTYVTGAASYQGSKPAPVAFVVDDTDTVTAEDVRVVKSNNNDTINQLQGTTWTLDFATSEYLESTGPIVVTDVIPDGLDWVGSSLALTSGPTANPDGTLTVVWTIPTMATQSTYVITYQTTTRTDYRGSGAPVSANDSWTNVVDLTTSTVLRSGALGTTTRAVATVIDHSQAGQVAEDVQRNKLIAAPVGNDCTAVTTWYDDSAAPFHPGDTVCFRLDVDFPDALDTVRARISDYLPAGFTLIGNPYYNVPLHDLGDSIALSYVKNPAGTVLNWTKDAVDVGTYFSVILTTQITGTATQKTDIAGNLLKVRYQNTATTTFQLRDLANAEITAPLLALDKVLVSPVSGTAEAGDAIHYRIDVTNTGKQAATNVEVRDVLPSGWTCAQVTSTNPATTCTAGVIQWTGLTVAAATATPGLLSLDVFGVAPATAAPGDLYTNRAGVRSYEGATNTGPAQVYYPTNNIDPTVTPNTDRADDSVDVTVGGATIAKVASSLVDGGNNSATQATIGELVTFTVTTTIPSGTTMYGSPAITDPVNGRYAIVGTPTYTVDTDGAGPGAPSAAVAAGLAGSTISIPLGPIDGGSATEYANPAGSGNDIVVLTYQARVLDAAANKRTLGAIPNIATVTWQSAAGTSRSATGQAPITVVEPNIVIAKTANQTTATPDSTILYTLTVTNPTGANVSTAHEIDVVDTVPAQLIPLTTGGVAAADGDTLLGTGGVWHSGTRTVTFSQIAAMAPGGAAVVYTFQAKVQNPTLTPGTVTNSVVVTATSLADPATGERTSTSPNGTGNGNGYIFTATRALNAPAITITSGASPGTRTAGQKVTYTLNVTIPAGTFAYDVLVRDTLAPGVRWFNDPVTVSCAPACSPNATATVIGTPTATDTVIGFWLDDLTASTASRTVTIVYTGIVTTTAATGNQQNSARVYTHTTDVVVGTPATVPATTGYTTGNQATATIVVQRPVLAIVKKVNGLDATRAKPGQVLHYTVAVTNSGTSPAYDLTITDTPDSDLTTYTPISMPGATAVDTDPSDGTLSWTIAGPIAVGATVTLAYDLTVPADFDETDEVLAGYELTNIADVPSYYGVPSAQRTLAATYYVNYNDVPADQADVELDLASIGDRVWFDVDGDGVQDAGEPGFAGVDVSVRFAGADNVFGNGDDEVVSTTTAADGYWLVQNLPGGQYRVSVDSADLPAGFAPSYDLDGIASAHNWTGALAQNGAPRTVDFGYTGSGSIGDRVWFDQDGDGVQDAAEPGIAGRTVTVVWQGLDGALGTADDVTYPTTTSSTGAYSVPRLPAGSYSVTVSGVPAGYGSTKDPDAVADGTALTTLTAGQNRTDQDFGYAGTGSIGDLVWIDRDEDGVYDLAGATPEQGVAGATIQLDWHGVTGTATDPVVATFSTTTDASGLYAFTRLVPGTYTVRVTGGLPASTTNTFDRDGNQNSQTPVTIAIGEAVTDADFGYSSDSSLGQRVWWDRNGDGVQDVGEPGFPGVDVSVLWYGPNGVAGDADDRVFATATAGDGYWSIPELPQGTYRVTIDTADLPAGMGQTFDADGVGTANSSVTVLGVGAVLTQNFGYRGALALGDLVFLDRDADGVQDAGEAGLAGVLVELSWPAQGITVYTTTAADGTYQFPGLVAGSYVARVITATLPSASLSAVSDLEGSSSDATANVTMALTSRGDADFGFRGDSSLGDLVWHDRDADGTVGADESGISGVTVSATWAGRDAILGTADDVVLTTVTGADGSYLFDHLPIGDWSVVIDASTLPAGFTAATFEEDATLDGTDLVALPAATDHVTADFGFRGTGSIGDRVWLDLDGDGAQDAGEPGVRGQRVDLVWAGRDGVLGTADDESWTTTTRADGVWLVEELPDGVFQVTINGGIATAASQTGDPDGTLDDATLVTLSPADRVEDAADFGYLGDNVLGDTVWWDEDADGVVDAAELPLAGVTVEDRWFGLDGLASTADDIVLTTVTDALGQYSFVGAPAGEHRVTVLSGIPAGLTPVSDRDGTGAAADGVSQVVFAAGLPGVSDLTHDFGYAGSGSLGDLVWLDLDSDGTQDPGEPGIPNATVTLTWAGVNGTFGDADDRVWTDLTDATGAYRFDGLPAGAFRIDLTGLPLDRVPTADPDGGAPDTATVALAAGEVQLTDDFGYIGDPTIGDTVFIDLDGDGAQGALEPGLSGVVLTIRHSGADKVLNTADDIVFTVTTNATGNYLVPGLPDGPVQVTYDPTLLPAGYVPSSDLDGGSPFDTVQTLTLVGNNLDIDFAIVGDAQLHGLVFDDRNGNGVRDAGEAGVPGVDLTVVWAGPAGSVLLLVTTDALGAWDLLNIPPGTYVTTIDASTVPVGYRVDTASVVTTVLPVGGNATVVMGITNAALALTGSDPRTNIAIGLLALLAGLGALTIARRQRTLLSRASA